MQFQQPVKFMGTETRTIAMPGKDPFQLVEAKLFIPDIGRVKVRIVGSPALPPVMSFVKLALSPEVGKFSSLVLQWDEASRFEVVK